jgi:GT2 family glycosyltransferase
LQELAFNSSKFFDRGGRIFVSEASESFRLVVVIATKDRHLALKYISLPSLAQSRFQEFATVVWDASDNDLAKGIADEFSSGLRLDFIKAPRTGLPSQRNDATKYILTKYPAMKYVLFIDDDTKLSPDALEGVVDTFEKYPDVTGVHIPLHDSSYPYNDSRPNPDGRYVLPPQTSPSKPHRFVKSHVVVGSLPPETNDTAVEWAQGCGMAFRRTVFTELGMRFNEELERFGGYALAEDVFFSAELRHRHGGKIWSALCGYSRHLEAPGGRVNEENRVASELYNLRLIFDMLNEKVFSTAYLWKLLRFKTGRLARLCAQCQQYSTGACWKGYLKAQRAYSEHEKGKRP